MLCYVVRHAESVVNAGLDVGVDSGLSPLGVRQAEAAAERLARTRLAAIYSSPYRRALQTAEALARRLKLPVRVRHELCEFQTSGGYGGPGPWPATMEQLRGEFSTVVADPDDDGATRFPPLDETLEAVIARTRRFGRFLKQRWSGADDAVAAFSHGLPVARMIDAWLTDSPGRAFRFVIDNAAVAALRHHNEVSSLVCMNEVSHLVGLPAAAASNYDAAWGVKAIPPSNYW